MKLKQFFLLTFLFFVFKSYSTNLLSGKYSAAELRLLIEQAPLTRLAPVIDDRKAWAKADQRYLVSSYEFAQKNRDYKWPSLPATVTLEFVRNGNRTHYEKISFEKRKMLFNFLIAEVYENKGRFMDQIMNGVWSICEESYWGINAHIIQSRSGAGLPDVSKPFVDLFTGETASLLATVDYIMGERFEKMAQQIRPRIHYEIEQRFFTPLMTVDHAWMGMDKTKRRPNNWNPWICSNWLNTLLLVEKDSKKKTEMVQRIVSILDNYLNPHPQDGGCDEGPAYWDGASAALFDNLTLLNQLSNGGFNYTYRDSLIRNLASYIYKVEISKGYFINFSDASPQVGINASMAWHFGKEIEDKKMMEFAAYFRKDEVPVENNYEKSFRFFFDIFTRAEFEKIPGRLPYPRDVWFPNLEVIATRDCEGSDKGWFVGAKGGNNDESHNHNDVGNYMVYYDGLPLLIDVGRGTYTARTFSAQRYEIWSNCSNYHNTPSINGVQQKDGPEFKAQKAAFKSDNKSSLFTLDISGAYPVEANVKSWLRSIRLDRGKGVSIREDYSLSKSADITNHLMTCCKVDNSQKGKLVLTQSRKNEEAKTFIISYDAKCWTASVELVPMNNPEDENIKKSWGGNTIRRINLKTTNAPLNGSNEIIISIE